MAILQAKQATLDLDRVLLNLGNPKAPDHQWTVRDLLRHTGVWGDSGVGKSSTIDFTLVKHILNRKKLPPEHRIGMLVFLFKDDLGDWLRWAEQCNRSDDLIIIGPNDKDILNPLAHYRQHEASTIVDLLSILSGLSLNGSSQQNSEAYWQQMANQRLHRLVSLLKMSGDELSIDNLHRIHSSAPVSPQQIEDEAFRKDSYCYRLIEQAYQHCGSSRTREFRMVEDYFIREMPYMADRTQSSILSMTSATLEPFLASPMLFNLFCGKTTISLDEMLRGKIVIFNLPIQKHGFAGKVAQMIFKHVLQKHIEARDLSLVPNPVVLHIDEYQHFISEYDPLFLSTARSARAGFFGLTQNISGLYAQIGGMNNIADEKVNALLGLISHNFYLAQSNIKTNKMASESIGEVRKILTSTNQNPGEMIGTGASETYYAQVPPRAFTMLKTGGRQHNGIVEAILTASGKSFGGRNYLKVKFQQPWFR